jgi:hypothetical protein
MRHDPVVGGSELELYGIGFFDSPTLVVRFQVTTTSLTRHTYIERHLYNI